MPPTHRAALLLLVACSDGSPAPRDASVADHPLDAEVMVGRLDAARDARSAADAASCLRAEYTALARPLDMLILLDQSGSMQEDEDRWTPTTNALKTFVGAPNLARTGVAMQYFPLGRNDEEKCEAARYAVPDVAMRTLPDNRDPVRASIDAHWFSHEECCDTEEHSGTPTRPAIEGAAAYLRDWLATQPDHVGVILLATDGEPSGVCDDNKVQNVANAIAEAASASPPVKTYVIGIGDNDALDELAEAGGTGQGALIVDGSGAQTEAQFLAAVERIRETALPCDYPLGDVDPSRLNLVASMGNTEVELRNVARREDCTRDGWYFDGTSRVALCPDACRELGQARGAVRIREGCQTVVAY
ncbi:MAG: vWA domain-containing protein [Polyangiales bacterium]